MSKLVAEADAALPMLRHVRSLQQLLPAELDALAQCCARRWWARGATVVTQGERGESLFLVESGSAVVALDEAPPSSGPREVGRCGAGDHFGEYALTENDYRQPATVVALTPVACLVLHRDDFLRYLQGPVISEDAE